MVHWVGSVQASLPPTAVPPTSEVVTELKAEKVTGPSLDADFEKLERAEARFAEPLEQQQRLRSSVDATSPRAAGKVKRN